MFERIKASRNVQCMATVALVFVVMHLKWLAKNPSIWATNGFAKYESVVCSQRVRTLMRPNEISRLCRRVSSANRADCQSFYTKQVDACKNVVFWFNDNFPECLVHSFRALTIYAPCGSAIIASCALLYLIVQVGNFSSHSKRTRSAETTRDKTIRILFCLALIAIVLVTATSFTTSSLEHIRHETTSQSVFCDHDNTLQYVLMVIGVVVTIGFVLITLISIWPQFRTVNRTNAHRHSNRSETESTSMTE